MEISSALYPDIDKSHKFEKRQNGWSTYLFMSQRIQKDMEMYCGKIGCAAFL